jgi:ADP-ribose diphosphatase
MRRKPEILSKNTIAKTRIFSVESLHLRFRNGEERTYERVTGSEQPAVMIVPLLDKETVLLIREYGVGVEDYYLGFPKGVVEAGENFLQAANREIMEEVGYGANHLELIKEFSLSPGYMSRSMALVVAQDLYPHRLPGDEPEEIEVVPWKLKNLDRLLDREDFHEGRSIAALFLIREWLNRGKS